MNPKYILKKDGFTDVIIRKNYWEDYWEMFTYRDFYGEEHWMKLDPLKFPEAIIKKQIQEYCIND